jgi:FG-GAP repeat protein
VQGVAQVGDNFGRALAAADFNGDGYSDLAIDVEDRESQILGGTVAILHGSPAGLQAVAPDDQLWSQDSPGVREVGEEDDAFGAYLEGADFNADGFDDLAVGAPSEDLGGVTSAGVLQVLFGSAAGLQATAPDDDLAVGILTEPSGAQLRAGAVYVLHGSVEGLQTTSPPDRLWSQDSPGVHDRAQENDVFGGDVSIGDVNGDGYADLVVGVPGETPFRTDAGAMQILYGSPQGTQAVTPDDQLWTQDAPGVEDVEEANDGLGEDVLVT